jgi:2',3'-cyclic-nucleotide 2'-phosphodiesterase / 3'-nucleotidase
VFLHFLLLLLTLLLPAAYAERVEIGVLVTTDLHGYILPYDYFTAKPAERGLAKIATLIRQERARTPNVLLVDCGDTIQGSPLEAVHQHWMRTGTLPVGMKLEGKPSRVDPMMAAMSKLGFDAMAVGNHEYNFGLKNFEAARAAATFPWLSANTQTPPGVMKPLAPYVVKTVAGVKVAIIGLTTPAVPGWEKPEHIKGFRFLDGVAASEAALVELRAKHKPDVVIVAVHAGLDRDLRTGAIRTGETGFENMVWQLANKVAGIDAIVFGHTHQQLEQAMVNGVLLHQPKNWGISLGRVDIALEREAGGAWKVVSKTGKLLPVTKEVAVDAEIAAIGKPYHELTERYLNTPVAQSPVALDGAMGRVSDSALVDAIHRVQLAMTKADVSLTALFNPRVRVPKGPVTVREIAALYIYDNELYMIEGNGRMLREALENAAKFFQSCRTETCEGPLTNREFIGFNFDMAQGVEYDIDLSKPVGSRVVNLRFRGKPLDDAQPLKIALNNYRAGGSGGYTMFRDAKVLYKSGTEIRDLIVDYYTERKALPAAADNNWRIVPEAARRTLEAEARVEAGRVSTY